MPKLRMGKTFILFSPPCLIHIFLPLIPAMLYHCLFSRTHTFYAEVHNEWANPLISASFLKLNKLTCIIKSLQFILKTESSSCLALMLLPTLNQKTVKSWSVHCAQWYLLSVFFFFWCLKNLQHTIDYKCQHITNI